MYGHFRFIHRKSVVRTVASQRFRQSWRNSFCISPPNRIRLSNFCYGNCLLLHQNLV